MRQRKLMVFLGGCLLLGFAAISSGPALGESDTATPGVDELLAIGKVASAPIELKVSIKGPNGKYPKSGQKSAVVFQTDKKAYVVVLGTSGKGSVDILFPNRAHPKALVLPEVEYPLAGGGSGILAYSSTAREAKWVVFYVSSQPVGLPGERVPAGKGWLSISAKDSDQVSNLADAIRSMSRSRGFNRITLPVRLKLVDCVAESCEGKLAQPKGFRLMGRPESDRPVGITGGQGRADPTKSRLPGQ